MNTSQFARSLALSIICLIIFLSTIAFVSPDVPGQRIKKYRITEIVLLEYHEGLWRPTSSSHRRAPSLPNISVRISRGDGKIVASSERLKRCTPLGVHSFMKRGLPFKANSLRESYAIEFLLDGKSKSERTFTAPFYFDGTYLLKKTAARKKSATVIPVHENGLAFEIHVEWR